MLPVDVRIVRLQNTLRRLEEDVPLLAMRVRDLPAERRASAVHFAQSLIGQARMELEKLLAQRSEIAGQSEPPCEPAD